MNSISKIRRLSVKAQTLWTLVAVASAVALPQIFHLIGAYSGLGTALGEAFLPMHLPVIAAGLLAGPYTGMAAGAISPLVSFALTGMPGEASLPFMLIELAFYGLVSGLTRDRRLPTAVKVLISQVAGRLARAAAVAFAVYAMGSSALSVSSVWNAVISGAFGILLQLTLLPLFVYRIEHAEKHGS